jgi:hypothetical protein
VEYPGGFAGGGAVEVDFEEGSVFGLDVEIRAVAAAAPILLRGGTGESTVLIGMLDRRHAILLVLPDKGRWLRRNALALNVYFLADEFCGHWEKRMLAPSSWCCTDDLRVLVKGGYSLISRISSRGRLGTWRRPDSSFQYSMESFIGSMTGCSLG